MLSDIPLMAEVDPFALLALGKAARVAVLAPHPDDFDAIGVSMRHLQRAGCDIHVAVLTTGASGVEDGFGGAIANDQKAAIREHEQRESCRLFGLAPDRLSFLRLAEDERGHQRDDAGNRSRVRAWLLERMPQAVFMPHGNDSNIAHQRTWSMFHAVAPELRAWACLNLDAKTIEMRRDLHVFFDDADAEWKAGLLRCHASQHARNLHTRGHGFAERVLAVNRAAALAAQGPGAYAEAFELIRFG